MITGTTWIFSSRLSLCFLRCISLMTLTNRLIENYGSLPGGVDIYCSPPLVAARTVVVVVAVVVEVVSTNENTR